MHLKKIGIIVVGLILVLMIIPSRCWTKDYPNKPIEFVNPYAPGGNNDLSIRIIGEKMAEFLGQPIVVVNKVGGAATVGTVYVANSKPDGYTLLGTTGGFLTRPLYDPRVPYRYTQFRPIGIPVKLENILCVNKNLPIKNIAELITYAKGNPGALSYSIAGKGGVSYLAMEYLKYKNNLTDLHLQCVPHQGDAPALLAILGNHVQISATNISFALPYIKSNSIRPIAILSRKRNPLLPEIPTSLEQGFQDMVASSYFIWLAPTQTPSEIIKTLENNMEKAIQDKGVQEKLLKIELTAAFMNSEETKAFLDNEIKFWEKIIKEANLATK
jgi:tripartite-type tricarboxylate transporter receptor subunit TctC